MDAARAIYFLARGEEARNAHQPLVLTVAELDELVLSIGDPPAECPTCAAPAGEPCTDRDNSLGPHWLPPQRNRLWGWVFNGVPVVTEET